jgi:Undecaprenyl-phosphate glucose phosphotransferase
MRHEHYRKGRIVEAGELAVLPKPAAPPPAAGGDGPQPGWGEEVRSPLIYRAVLAGVVRASESALVMLLAAAVWAYHVDDFALDLSIRYLSLIVAVGMALPLFAQAAGLYSVGALLRASDQMARLSFIWSIIFAGIFAIVFFTKAGESFSRVWLGAWFLGGLSLLIFYRLAVSAIVRRWNADGRLDRRTVLVGGGKPAADLLSALSATRNKDIAVVGLFDDRGDDRSPTEVGGLRKIGSVADLVDFARNSRVDLMIVTLPLTAESRLLEVLKQLWVLPADIRLSAYSQRLRYRPRAYSWIGNVPFLDAFDKPLTGWDSFLKAVEDKVIAALAIMVLSPVMAAVALAIKLDSKGPVLFRQKRYGFNNELIEVYKFRSMHVESCDADARKLVTRDDPRVTRVGRFIRRTSLDELPQLFNVLEGGLSLVGPRPHATQAKARDKLYDEVVEGYYARHKMKPGITGWAQVNGWRGETDTPEKIQRRVEHDLYYIENWSLFLDLYILAKTPFALLKSENAY